MKLERKQQRQDELLQLKSDFKLTNKNIAELCHVSIYAVESWFRTTKARTTIPESTLSYLKTQLNPEEDKL